MPIYSDSQGDIWILSLKNAFLVSHFCFTIILKGRPLLKIGHAPVAYDLHLKMNFCALVMG
jgi:hypothetical protein